MSFLARRAAVTISARLAEDGPIDKAKQTVDKAQKAAGKKLAEGIDSAEKATKSAASTMGIKGEEAKKDAKKAGEEAKFQAKKATS